MMKTVRYLLDTNICISFLRGNRNVADKLIAIGEGNCYLSIITVYELMFGAYYSKHEAREVPKVKLFIDRFPIVSLLDSAEVYAVEKTKLQSAGILIDEFDLLIASTALSGDFVLVTDNIKHFQRIAGLKIENWIR